MMFENSIGGLNKNGSHRLMRLSAQGVALFVGAGVVLLKEVYHQWALRFQKPKPVPVFLFS